METRWSRTACGAQGRTQAEFMWWVTGLMDCSVDTAGYNVNNHDGCVWLPAECRND